MSPEVGEPGTTLRLAREEDLPTCAEIHRVAIDDYLVRAGQPAMAWGAAPLIAFLSHLLATDPDRFLVAEGGSEVVGFASAWERGDVWFLAMLFVLPAHQARGLGTRLLEAVLPRPGEARPEGRPLRLGVATDSLQPISNALYARYGMVPRVPVFLLSGPVTHPGGFPPLPAGVAATPFETIAAGPPDGPGHRRLADVTGAIDREVVGYAHPEDHRYLRANGRHGQLYSDRDGVLLGYGYVRDDGRLGPVAAVDDAMIPVILGHLAASATPPDGGFSLLVPGACGPAMTAALRAGLRILEPPTLLCWDRPIADVARYLPIGLGLL
jgi:GNAT superfamily N-acetyltransferase